jgi:hypothetical protein
VLGISLALAVGLSVLVVAVLVTDREGDVPAVPSGAVDIPARSWTGQGSTGPSPGRCRGVDVHVGDDPHRVMGRHPPGTTFCLGPGVHRLTQPLRPQEGDTLQGRTGAVLNGAAVLTGWRQVPEGWRTTGRLPDEPSDAGECLSEQPDCTAAEDVFLDGQRLVRAASADEVTPTSFFADYSAGTVTLGTDPTGRLVEQAVAPALVRSADSSVTVRDLVVEMAANPAQEAAVDGRTSSPRTGSRWRVLHNLVRLNHGVGVGVGSRGVVRGNEIRGQGQLGVSVWERGARVLDNLVVENGTAGYDPDWEAGGLKAWVTEDVQIVGNQVHGNRGPGLWSDGGCLRTTYRRNVVTQNWGAGIQHEISHDARIVRNRISDNGLRHKGWAWEAGISIQSSGGLGRIVVRRNTVTLSEGQWTGIVQDVDDHEVFRRGIRFVGNTYRLASATQRAFAWEDDLLTWQQWRRYARQDPQGSTVVLP